MPHRTAHNTLLLSCENGLVHYPSESLQGFPAIHIICFNFTGLGTYQIISHPHLLYWVSFPNMEHHWAVQSPTHKIQEVFAVSPSVLQGTEALPDELQDLIFVCRTGREALQA